jgi:hypothetical protein
MASEPRARPDTADVPAADLERLEALLVTGYEGLVDLADRGRIDWSISGQPLADALRIVRRLLAERAA